MRRRLVASTGLIALAAVLVLGIPLGIVEGRRERTDARARLEREADAVAAAVDDRLEAGLPVTRANVAPLVRPGHAATVVAPGRPVTRAGARLQGETITERSGAVHPALVTVSEPRSEVDHRVTGVWLLIVALGAGGVAAAAGLAALQARRLVRPLDAMADASRRLGRGDFSARAGRSGVAELDVVADALDASAARIAEMVAREREFSGNVSHQLRTPLTALRLRLEELAALDDPARRREEAELALAEADRLDATIGALLQHARGAPDEVSEIDLDAVVRDHARRWERVYRAAGRRLVLQLGLGGREVAASPAAAGQVLDVLLENALRHGAGTATVTTRAEGRHACMAVEDQGAGVPADAPDIFDRGASARAGSGIGLHLARTLAMAYAGRLELARRAPPRFELRLRLSGQAADGIARNDGVHAR